MEQHLQRQGGAGEPQGASAAGVQGVLGIGRRRDQASGSCQITEDPVSTAYQPGLCPACRGPPQKGF